MATFTVTNTNYSGVGSLQQAVLDANALTGKDIINFGGLFKDSIADTITLAGSSLSITDDLKINGTGADLLTVSGNNASGVFDISSYGITVEIKGLTITKGNNSGISNSGILTVSNSTITGNSAGGGGGISNSGTLTVNNSTITGNTANDGGGIWSYGGTVTVSNSTISDNLANFYYGGRGGGIFNVANSTLIVKNSIISDNLVTGDNFNNSFYNSGGGIYNYNGATVKVCNSIISDNSAESGGGIYNYNATLTVNDSTISNKLARFFGGGIYNFGDSTLTINNSTITGNSANPSNKGIYNYSNGTVTVNGSTISNNYTGITNDGGTFTLIRSTVSGNSAIGYYDENQYYYRGIISGISNLGTLTVIGSTISDNSANIYGGILNLGTLTVIGSTISDNSATGYQNEIGSGGGIYNFGTVTLLNSTISGNSAQNGSGIYNHGSLIVTNSTIVLNTAYYGGYYTGGAGIFNFNNGTAKIKNSIIAGNNNAATNPTSPDVLGKFISNGYNLIGSLGSSTGFNASEQLTVPITDVIDTSLGNNGGLVKTHALVIGSRAINGGNNADVPADTKDLDKDGNTTEKIPFDARGSGFARISGGRVDIGAFEAQVKVINGNCGNNELYGTAGNDIITGYYGKDTLTGGAGADAFVYTNIQDAGDTITDFENGTDRIVLRQLFQKYNLNLNYDSAIAGGYLRFETQGTDAIVLIDSDGSSGSGPAVKLVTLKNESVNALKKGINFAF